VNGERRPVCWVLGAGASRALGGPLIDQLLEYKPEELIRELHPVVPGEPDLPDAMHRVRWFYNHGKVVGRWRHAEEFIDIVETAQGQTPHPELPPQSLTLLTRLIQGVADPTNSNQGVANLPNGEPCTFENLYTLGRAARQTLAADCCTFLRGADPETERWQPYCEWAHALDGHHSVVTFNYDIVPEILGKRAGGKLQVVCGPAGNVAEEISKIRVAGCAPVFKVHGSTNWGVFPNGDIAAGYWESEWGVIAPPDQKVLMGVPGPRKRALINGALKHVWDQGMEAIRTAYTVIFVGYRFPPTDSDSRSAVLAALKTNPYSHLSVFTVLGPQSADTARLTAMLNWAVRGRGMVKSLPYYAEDFFALAGPMGLMNTGG
jgi:hypothetical protein